MRRIKHWAGYGCVKAGVVGRTKNSLEIKVVGNHERGLELDDSYDVFNWLVKRFDKTRSDYTEIKDFNVDEEYHYTDDGYVDGITATFKIVFKD